jgi:hypothetical protein
MQASGAVSPVSNRDEPAAGSGSRLVTGVTAQVTRSAQPGSAGGSLESRHSLRVLRSQVRWWITGVTAQLARSAQPGPLVGS